MNEIDQKDPAGAIIDPVAGTYASSGVPIWNPFEHGIPKTPLMVRAHEHNSVVYKLEQQIEELKEAIQAAIPYLDTDKDLTDQDIESTGERSKGRRRALRLCQAVAKKEVSKYQ